MKTPSKLLADALALPEQIDMTWHEAIPSVLGRPTGGEASVRLRFARNVLLTTGTACQLVTAAAHSDDYAHYPVVLLRALSFDPSGTRWEYAESVIRTLGA